MVKSITILLSSLLIFSTSLAAEQNPCLKPGGKELTNTAQRKLSALTRSSGCSIFGYSAECSAMAGVGGAATLTAAGGAAAARMMNPRNPNFNVCGIARVEKQDTKTGQWYWATLVIPEAIAAPACALEVASKMRTQALEESVQAGLADISRGNAATKEEMAAVLKKHPELDSQAQIKKIVESRETFSDEIEKLQKQMAETNGKLSQTLDNHKQVRALNEKLTDKLSEYMRLDNEVAWATGDDYKKKLALLQNAEVEMNKMAKARDELMSKIPGLSPQSQAGLLESRWLGSAAKARAEADALVRKANPANLPVLQKIEQLAAKLSENAKREQLLVGARKTLGSLKTSLPIVVPMEQNKIFHQLSEVVKPTSVEMRSRLSGFQLLQNLANNEIQGEVAATGEKAMAGRLFKAATGGLFKGHGLKGRLVSAAVATASIVSPVVASAAEDETVKYVAGGIDTATSYIDPTAYAEWGIVKTYQGADYLATNAWYTAHGECGDKVRSGDFEYFNDRSCSEFKIEYNDRNLGFVVASPEEQRKTLAGPAGAEYCTFIDKMYDRTYSGWTGNCRQQTGTVYASNGRVAFQAKNLDDLISGKLSPENYSRSLESSIGSSAKSEIALHLLEVQHCCAGTGRLSASDCSIYHLKNMPTANSGRPDQQGTPGGTN